jgi:hypothetical protein
VTACNNSRIKYIFLVKKYIFRTDQKRFSCSPEIKSQKPKSQFYRVAIFVFSFYRVEDLTRLNDMLLDAGYRKKLVSSEILGC